ncbi:DNA mismatch repair protein msh6 [Erysiphe neolycopersici]|uniref:DNA mismatch repair protein n=1 Tax=Erysiphe neolycopersici TaxID=212602 RepID=A0A420H7F1_9PEZI|nr:DNA mismatch repair protein msh6 [Erysiphe neolycopersici]
MVDIKSIAQTVPAIQTPSTKRFKGCSQFSTQRKIQSFFTKSPANSSPIISNHIPSKNDVIEKVASIVQQTHVPIKQPNFEKLTSVPITTASEILNPQKRQENVSSATNGLKAKKSLNYDEYESDSEEDVFEPTQASRKRRKVQISKPKKDFDEDAFSDSSSEVTNRDDVEKTFEDEEESSVPVSNHRKRKRQTTSPDDNISNLDIEHSSNSSTVNQWKFDPENICRTGPKRSLAPSIRKSKSKTIKEKAHKSEPEKRYPWLAQIRDMDGNPVGHPEYDPRTVFIPPYAWNKFSAFENQYWKIKQKFWDTVVFFKKGKFYELYENDATIGHQLFDLKLTDRVNMRMVGVPESSLSHWANQFVAKGFKIARVDQCESALGKEMREAETGDKAKKPVDKIIKRELACVLTSGTLVDESMLQDDMATYCVAIKEGTQDELPAFGFAIVDTATAQFLISEFIDDDDLTKFETLVAQIRPQELLLEKSAISPKAMRILKCNTNPTTIWNYLKPKSEFWSADITRRELECSGYFLNEGIDTWPEKLIEAKEKELLMSAVGALVQYLRSLKLERSLLSQKNFNSYNPIQKGSSLVLDGKTLINLEIFTNTSDGTSNGTLFDLINRCVTPFGKRLFRQWVCHPLADALKINERLDAVEMINKDRTLSDHFTECMSGLPDLERLLSRIHAGSCRPEDFVKVVTAFGQIGYTIDLLESYKNGEGCIARLLRAIPSTKEKLNWWLTAFDHSKAKEHKILVPTKGVEEEFDNSQENIYEIERQLTSLLEKKRKDLGSASQITYKNVGKEIYQLEVPASIKVPKDWQIMSSAGKFKRYYFAELRHLIRQLQEARETHSQIIKQVALRFYARFDLDYKLWQQVIKIVAQIDCLIGIATASASLGEPSCRPKFVETYNSVLKFEELRHPCMVSHVTDYIPNDIMLGGDTAKITLLTGANAAGKSTILRMTCIAVIMAQIGCYVPAISATLTPVDRIMSRLGANDNIFAAQSTFFVELYETKKILSEATPRSLVILDELGRGTSSYDGVAVAQSVLHHIATHIGCIGFFATHYHSLASEFANHPEILAKRMQIHVDENQRHITFLYKLEDGVAESSFGMHCAAMCGIPNKIIDRAEVSAKEWEHTSRLKESLENARSGCYLPLGLRSDVSWALKHASNTKGISERGLEVLLRAIENL